MKRSGYLRRNTPLQTYGNATIIRETPLAKKGKQESAVLKDTIQGLTRAIVIIRDGGCILRSIQRPDIPACGGYRKDGQLILQADHLVTRANSATFADTRLIVCVCKAHHGWKSVGSNLRKAEYDALVKIILPPERVALWEHAEKDSWKPVRMGVYDWKLSIIALEAELKQYDLLIPDRLQ